VEEPAQHDLKIERESTRRGDSLRFRTLGRWKSRVLEDIWSEGKQLRSYAARSEQGQGTLVMLLCT
jgi:conjugal transfer/entry exclusion protein